MYIQHDSKATYEFLNRYTDLPTCWKNIWSIHNVISLRFLRIIKVINSCNHGQHLHMGKYWQVLLQPVSNISIYDWKIRNAQTTAEIMTQWIKYCFDSYQATPQSKEVRWLTILWALGALHSLAFRKRTKIPLRFPWCTFCKHI